MLTAPPLVPLATVGHGDAVYQTVNWKVPPLTALVTADSVSVAQNVFRRFQAYQTDPRMRGRCGKMIQKVLWLTDQRPDMRLFSASRPLLLSIAVLQRNAIMSWTHVIWDPTPGGNVEHVEEHDLTTDDVDHVLTNYESKGVSASSGRPCVFGHTPDDRYIVVVYEEVDEDTVVPVTAYEVPEP